MNCRDFDQTWNRLLDAESAPRRDDPEAAASLLAREAGLRGHAESCPSCRIRHRGFEALRAAMRAWSASPRPEPTAAPDAVDRIVRAAASIEAPRPRRSWAPAWASGLAAAALAAAFFRPSPRDEPAPAPAPRASLSVAVADAREASLRLALTASEPAARLGLAMLDASIATDFGPDDAAPAADDDADDGPDASDLAARVGGYAAAGARPLSDAARRAFGFLRSPSLDKTAPTASPRGT